MKATTERSSRDPFRPFWIDAFEVTNAQFADFVAATGYRTDAEEARCADTWRARAISGRERHPVVNVTWHDARAYCDWVGSRLGRRTRLPTADEWERAARGLEKFLFPWGIEFDLRMCRSVDTSSELAPTVPVDLHDLGASPYGVRDLVGNVAEWTEPVGGGGAVTMGGSWRMSCELFGLPSLRVAEGASTWRDDLGFRCAWDA